jgi:hypothetical protein
VEPGDWNRGGKAQPLRKKLHGRLPLVGVCPPSTKYAQPWLPHHSRCIELPRRGHGGERPGVRSLPRAWAPATRAPIANGRCESWRGCGDGSCGGLGPRWSVHRAVRAPGQQHHVPLRRMLLQCGAVRHVGVLLRVCHRLPEQLLGACMLLSGVKLLPYSFCFLLLRSTVLGAPRAPALGRPPGALGRPPAKTPGAWRPEVDFLFKGQRV